MKTILISVCASVLFACAASAQVSVTVHNVVGKAGTTRDISITVGDLTGLNVISYQFTLTYDTAIVRITGNTTAGTVTASMDQVVVNFATAGTVQVAASGTTVLAGSGTLLKLTATFVAPGTSALTVSGFTFNEGTPAATVTNGTAMVPTLSVNFPVDGRDTIRVGHTITIPILTDDITGKGILSYQFAAIYDPTIFKIIDVSTAGTMSSAITNFSLDTTIAGRIAVAAAGTTPLAGSGTLINLVARLNMWGGCFDLAFESFMYNEGDPAVGAIDGTICMPYIDGIRNEHINSSQFELIQNYPNPFNPSTTISFDLADVSDITLEVYDILGRKVRTLLAGKHMIAATHSVVWDGTGDSGKPVPSGVYFCRLNADGVKASRKMLLAK